MVAFQYDIGATILSKDNLQELTNGPRWLIRAVKINYNNVCWQAVRTRQKICRKPSWPSLGCLQGDGDCQSALFSVRCLYRASVRLNDPLRDG